MVADVSKYAGREQAYVKHYFLESYLESLIFKIASRYDEIAYVDGFSGPWQSTGENFEDTSFGIAVTALRKAKETWKAQSGRDVKMSAYLVEKAASAYSALEALKPKFPDIEINTYNADFMAVAPTLLTAIPRDAFVFLFIDPKGWRFDMKQLAPLLSRQPSEVVFNFMFDFINRAASMKDPKLITALAELMPYGDWQAKLAGLDKDSEEVAAQRREVLAEAFRETLRQLGRFDYVAEVPVLRPINDRTLYSLFYGTRSTKGIEVFRDCHVKTERQQARVRSQTKQAHREAKTNQLRLFAADVPLVRDETEEFLGCEKRAAKATLLAMVPVSPKSITYEEVWPRVLERHVVTKPEVNSMAAELRRSGKLMFADWELRRRVPQDQYRVSKVD